MAKQYNRNIRDWISRSGSRKVILQFSIVIVLALIVEIQAYMFVYSDSGIMNRVLEKDGFTVSMVEERVPIEVFVKSEWLESTRTKKSKVLKANVYADHGTTIVLNDVLNRENDMYFSFTTSFHMNHEAGEFLNNWRINDNGTFTTPNGTVQLYDRSGNEIPLSQTGAGPGPSFSFAVEAEHVPLIQDGFYVNYDGYNLYSYAKL